MVAAPSLAAGYQASWASGHNLTPGLTGDMLHAVHCASEPSTDGRPMVRKLERRWVDATSRTHAVACRSGRVALMLALDGLDLDPGDEVILPGDAARLARTVAHARYTPVPADVHPLHLHLDPTCVEDAISPRTRAVIAVDRHGATADYGRLADICGRHGLSLVEDGSQSLGAVFDQRPVGSHGHVSICGFVGEDLRSSLGTAGLLATDDDRLAASARRGLLVDQPLDDFDVDPLSGLVGTSSQLSELDAAVCEGRLSDLWGRLATRMRNGRHLRSRLGAIPGVWVAEAVRGANHVYASLPLQVMPDELGLPEDAAATLRDTVIDCLMAEGLVVERWQQRPWVRGDAMPVASALACTGMVLGGERCPFDDPHTTDTMDRIADCFHKLFVDNVDRLRALVGERLT